MTTSEQADRDEASSYPSNMGQPVSRLSLGRVISAIVALVLIAAIWTVVCALKARTDLNSARSDFSAVQADPPSNLSELSQHLDKDQHLAAAAASDMGQPGPWLIRHIPIIGRSFNAERVIAHAADSLISSAEPVVRDAGQLSSGGSGSGGINLSTLSALQQALAAAPRADAAAAKSLQSLNFGLTPPFVSRLGHQASAQLQSAITGLGTASEAVGAVRGVLGGSGRRTVMVALENNAELRGTGGLISSFALGTATNGELKLGRFRDVDTVARDPSYQKITTVPAAADYLRAYHSDFLANSTVWRNANMSSDIPESAKVISELAGVSLHRTPDVVILVDVPAMAAIVNGTVGKVQLPDGQDVSGADLTKALLLQSYGKATLNVKVEQRRKAQLDAAAGNVFAEVSAAKPSLGLLRALASAASGRHIVIWSNRPSEESALQAAGIAGGVQPGAADLAMVTDQDLGSSSTYGNKLDYYIRRKLSMSVALSRTEATVSETLTLTNNTPSGLGPYIVGKSHPGRLNELVGIAVPATATVADFTSGGQSVAAQVLPADGTREVRTIAQIEPHSSESWTLTYTMPITHDTFDLVGIPQPLAVPAQFDLSIKPASGVELTGTGPTVVTDNEVTRGGGWVGQVTVDLHLGSPSLQSRWRSDLNKFWHHKIHF